MNNLFVRALAGLVYVAVIIGCIFAGYIAFWALMAAFVCLGLYEFQRLVALKLPLGAKSRWFDFIVTAIVFGLLIFPGAVIDELSDETYLFGGLLCLVILILYMPVRLMISVGDRTETSLRATAFSTLAMFYVVMPLAFFTLAYAAHGRTAVLATFIFLWLNDTGAYLSGITFGRHKLCERLSPKKSWEGFWGGFVLCLIGGAVTAWICDHNFVLWIIYAAIVSVFATFGDLFESLLKRTVGVKDSGALIPGHGGILDRIDSLLAVAPITLIFAFFSQGL